ncbi:unnamed protein product [Schistosoma curassoni]|uniref:NDK domain-containing protein n=1 Tax=Schistosoma curassoni TaxID=6186 RepID=A0A183JYL8_9TREM|nr:unnamed protein product [Schistosoma curassoni]
MSDAQLQIIHNEEVFMTRDRAQVFYAEHKGESSISTNCVNAPEFAFRPLSLVKNLLATRRHGPLGVYILAGNNAISVWRSLLGPTKVYRTVVYEPNSLRGRFGLTDTRNGFHGSDSQENAFKEIKFFFPSFNCESILSDL